MVFQIYSKPGCAPCYQAKQKLASLEEEYVEFIIGEHLTRYEFFEMFPGVKSVPMILRDGKIIGGNDDLTTYLAEGKHRNVEVKEDQGGAASATEEHHSPPEKACS